MKETLLECAPRSGHSRLPQRRRTTHMDARTLVKQILSHLCFELQYLCLSRSTWLCVFVSAGALCLAIGHPQTHISKFGLS